MADIINYDLKFQPFAFRTKLYCATSCLDFEIMTMRQSAMHPVYGVFLYGIKKNNNFALCIML
jgi:hypothetical protein